MNQPAAVPMIVLTRQQDQVEAVNRALRKAGHPVHPSWLPDSTDFGDALLQVVPEIVILFAENGSSEVDTALEIRARFAPEVPVVVVTDGLDESTMARFMRAGAQDVVTIDNVERLQLVVSRELKAFRLDRALSSTLSSAREARRQLQAFMTGSADAIAHVQEGIVVDANPAWLDLFGYDDAEALVGMPAMDLFNPAGHAAIKGALSACLQGRWSGHPLRATALMADGTGLELEFQFGSAEFEGEAAVRIAVPAGTRDNQEMERKLTEAVQCDATTGLLHRKFFVEAVRRRLTEPVRGGVRHFAYVEPDKFDAVLADIGVLAGEDFLAEFARLLRQQLQPSDIGVRFAGNGFMLLIERGNTRDVGAWADHVLNKVGAEVFQVGARSISTTCTIGLGLVPGSVMDPDGPASDAFEANRRGREQGGNRVIWSDESGMHLRVLDGDKLWVRHIKSALMDGRFRLVQQPIASLLGDDKGMYDVMVRMIDDQGDEVLPSEFIPAAERHDLMKNIDRWVIGASMAFAAQRLPGALFVRLSADTLRDPSLTIWLQNQLRSTRADGERIVFQLAESVAAPSLRQAIELRDSLRRLGFRFALEGFGSGRDPEGLAHHLKPDFVKIAGALMQGLANDTEKQQLVKHLVATARAAGAVTIAERVEDANTMAVLWQLGVEFIQGFFVNAPEEIVLG